jgi:hypothetical protein
MIESSTPPDASDLADAPGRINTPETPEPQTSSGEGDLSSEQDDVMRATENDETHDEEANLIA